MKRVKLGAALLVAATLLGTVAPAMAAEEPLEKATQGGLMVTRVGGMASGVVLGTPIATGRETYKSYISFTEAAADKVGGKVGGKDSGPVCLVVSLVTLPAAVVVGGAKGLYYGVKNGVWGGFEKPFYKDSYSLGVLDE